MSKGAISSLYGSRPFPGSRERKVLRFVPSDPSISAVRGGRVPRTRTAQKETIENKWEVSGHLLGVPTRRCVRKIPIPRFNRPSHRVQRVSAIESRVSTHKTTKLIVRVRITSCLLPPPRSIRVLNSIRSRLESQRSRTRVQNLTTAIRTLRSLRHIQKSCDRGLNIRK